MASLWDQFAHDPRAAENAHLRASDRDRDVVNDLLGAAYADGRLTRSEFDERTDQVARARTLGDLPPLVSDLVTSSSRTVLRGDDLRQEAERRYAKARGEALLRALTPSLICWVIWAWVLVADSGTPFPWPVFVTIGTGMHFVRLAMNREGSIESIQRQLEKKQVKELERRRDA